MLRRSSTLMLFHDTTGPAKWCGHPTNENADELIMYLKNARKVRTYLGSHFQRCPDREIMYMSMGGPRGGRFTIKRAHNKKQFYHHNMGHNKWEIHHTNPTNAWSGVGSGGQYHDINGNQVNGTNAWWDQTFKMNAKDLKKDKAIEWMESWGVKYRMLDENSQPRFREFIYHRHKLYLHNFPWIRDPVVNSHQGDADHVWRGSEVFDYSVHGANTKSVANEFRSLWGIPAAASQQQQAAPTAAAPASPAPAASKKAAPAAEKPKPKADKPKKE